MRHKNSLQHNKTRTSVTLKYYFKFKDNYNHKDNFFL
ncbi:hypothetical protein Patl1_22667 [Pistacia atlantica]|uniref:Uncharacterized protein n=1 Tax=Pistacia atlantica TaxID=434234 RepID=A0ACC0ZZX6_9ROSI|nr:hypothetical protein Patl1_22667 [Pistacia atlantica]